MWASRVNNQRAILVPEGVPLQIERAEMSERATAFAIDFFITDVVAIALLLGIGFMFGAGNDVTIAAALFAVFVVRNAYFVCFELLWAGSTPGKRLLGLRVIDRRGGPLTPAAVVARNLSREVETFFPLALVLSAQSWAVSWWQVIPPAIWLILTTLLPLSNRDNLRAGDLIGGTMVIAIPKKQLFEDLARRAQSFQFSHDQLQHYGIHELQVLEDVLRGTDSPSAKALMTDIAARIVRRIGWRSPVRTEEARAFLTDFYAAQRSLLERRKHLGEERADKHYRDSS